MSRNVIGGLVAALVAGVIGTTSVTPANAQASSRTEKTFGGWIATCLENNAGKRCSMTHQLVSNQTRRPVFTLTISAARGAEQNITISIPTGVSLRDGITLGVGDQSPAPLQFSVCGPRACMATGPLDAKLLGDLRAQPKALANYVRANKQLVQVDVDLAGFADAYAYISGETQ